MLKAPLLQSGDAAALSDTATDEAGFKLFGAGLSGQASGKRQKVAPTGGAGTAGSSSDDSQHYVHWPAVNQVNASRSSATCLLVAHTLTKLGSKAWEFATPLLLLYFSPGSLLAPTVFGFVIFLVRFMLGPSAGAWVDRTKRLTVVQVGIILQTLGVAGALVLLLPLEASAAQWSRADGDGDALGRTMLLPLVIVCGCAEALGALLSSLSLKRDWVPALWPSERSLSELNSINVAMSNVDLGAEMLGPVGAGLVLQATGSIFGFTVIGLANIISFGLELLLLQAVYANNPVLAAPKAVINERAQHALRSVASGWRTFLQQPCGAPLLVISYSLLYFTVLSPHGVVLTAYLQMKDMGEARLSLFRAAGALSGVLGMGAYRYGSKLIGVRRTALIHVALLAACVAGAAACFGAAGIGDPQYKDPGGAMVAFLLLLIISRFGLYGFDVALLQLEQMNVDERHRGLVGAVESSLCSLGTMSVFAATMATSANRAAAFGWLVYASVGFVFAGAVCFATWCMCWHAHLHSHGSTPVPGVPHQTHAHTLQQERKLEGGDESRTHTHLHFHPPFGDMWKHLRARDVVTDKA